MRRSEGARAAGWLRFYTAAVVLFLFFPIFIIVPLSFSADRFLSFPPSGYGLRWYRSYLDDPTWLAATWRSVSVGVMASSLATLNGVVFVVWLQRFAGRRWRWLKTVVMAPAIVPNILFAVGLFMVTVYLGLTDSEAALVGAHAILGLPFVVLILSASLKEVDGGLERAARIFGAGPIRGFVVGTLPSLLPAVVSAWLFAFFTSFDELVVALFTMGGSVTLPVRIWTDLQFEINPTVSAVSVILIVVTVLGMSAAEWLRRRTGRAT